MASVLNANDRQGFVSHYNRSSFEFRHSLSELGIFDTRELVEMAGRLPDPAYYSAAESAIDDGWKQVGDRRLSLEQALERLNETSTLVLLRNCQRDPKHGWIFQQLMNEIVDQVGDPLRGDLDMGRATIVISSPRRVTSYHIDAEVNFLLQVRGTKLLHAFDPHDRAVLSETELESFYAGNVDAARYTEERQSRAHVYRLEPGTGIHLPLHAPHWAQNLDDVSIGVSFNFNLLSGARLAQLYKMNNLLRRTGLRPAAPGASAWQDRLKVVASSALSQGRALAKQRASKQRAS